MSKRAISGIIGLMAIALAGIVIMQVYWISRSYSINQEQFDKNVYVALQRISDRIAKDDVDIASKNFMYTCLSPAAGAIQEYKSVTVSGNSDLEVENAFTDDFPIDSFLTLEDDVFFHQPHVKNCNCHQCKLELVFRQMEQSITQRFFNPPPISERIDLNRMDEIIDSELRNKGIKINYYYGVFSDERQKFVVTKNMDCVGASGDPQITQTNLNHLIQTDYAVPLFPADIRLPGYLMIHFPNKVSYIWRSISLALLLSVLFTGIILYCFIYTLQIIFRQKKLSNIKNDFINNMTHEFKTPIATISLAADSINNPLVINDHKKLKRFADIIKAENIRMNKQVEKVLQIALLDKQEFEMNIKELDINQVISKAVNNLNLQVEQKDGEIIQDLQAYKPEIKADETHFSNVIHNLLDNANKYSPEKPKITVRSKNTDEGLWVSIEDEGIGITREDRQRIFDKFYRVSTGNIHDVKGFGLGLSYVKAIMDKHGGTIDVKSEIGKGSKFSLFFPYEQKI